MHNVLIVDADITPIKFGHDDILLVLLQLNGDGVGILSGGSDRHVRSNLLCEARTGDELECAIQLIGRINSEAEGGSAGVGCVLGRGPYE